MFRWRTQPPNQCHTDCVLRNRSRMQARILISTPKKQKSKLSSAPLRCVPSQYPLLVAIALNSLDGLQKALDEGTMARVDIEKRFEVLTNEAARLRKLQVLLQHSLCACEQLLRRRSRKSRQRSPLSKCQHWQLCLPNLSLRLLSSWHQWLLLVT